MPWTCTCKKGAYLVSWDDGMIGTKGGETEEKTTGTTDWIELRINTEWIEWTEWITELNGSNFNRCILVAFNFDAVFCFLEFVYLWVSFGCLLLLIATEGCPLL